MISVILAAPDLHAEPLLVVAAPGAGLQIIRRCVDASDLLACAAAEPETAVVLSAGVPRLSSDVIARMDQSRRPLIALAVTDEDEARARAWGIGSVVRLGSPEATMAGIAMALDLADAGSGHQSNDAHSGATASSLDDPGGGVWTTGVWPAPRSGMLIAVWGPPGSPGRTCTAIGLAQACAERGRQVLLVDGDTHAASIGMMLGMVDEASGLIVACRHADNGTLSPRTLRATARSLRPGLSVLTGLPRPDRWPDAREGALERLWPSCREAFEVTVVDIGADLDEDAHGSMNPVLGSRRNAAALSLLGQCDAVISVCRTDPLSIARLAIAYPAMRAAAPQASRLIGVIAAERGMAARRELRSALGGIGIADPVMRLEPTPRQTRRRLARGLLHGESGINRRERAGLQQLAARLMENSRPIESSGWGSSGSARMPAEARV